MTFCEEFLTDLLGKGVFHLNLLTVPTLNFNDHTN